MVDPTSPWCPGRREPSSARTQGGPISGDIGPTEDAAMRRFAAAAPPRRGFPPQGYDQARGDVGSTICLAGLDLFPRGLVGGPLRDELLEVDRGGEPVRVADSQRIGR